MVIKTSVHLHAEIQSGKAETQKNTMENVFSAPEGLLPLTSFDWMGKVTPHTGGSWIDPITNSTNGKKIIVINKQVLST